jgi:hypothetical protein
VAALDLSRGPNPEHLPRERRHTDPSFQARGPGHMRVDTSRCHPSGSTRFRLVIEGESTHSDELLLEVSEKVARG